MKMGWIRRQSPEKIHPKNQSALERSAAASADAASAAAREAAASAAARAIGTRSQLTDALVIHIVK